MFDEGKPMSGRNDSLETRIQGGGIMNRGNRFWMVAMILSLATAASADKTLHAGCDSSSTVVGAPGNCWDASTSPTRA